MSKNNMSKNLSKKLISQLIPQKLFDQIIETRTGIPTESEKLLLQRCCLTTDDVLYRTAKMQQILKLLYTILDMNEFYEYTKDDVLSAIKRVKVAIKEHRNNPYYFIDDVEVACNKFLQQFNINIEDLNNEALIDLYIFGYLNAMWYKKRYIQNVQNIQKKSQCSSQNSLNNEQNKKYHFDNEIFMKMKMLIIQSYDKMDISLLEDKLNSKEKELYVYFKNKNDLELKNMSFYRFVNK